MFKYCCLKKQSKKNTDILDTYNDLDEKIVIAFMCVCQLCDYGEEIHVYFSIKTGNKGEQFAKSGIKYRSVKFKSCAFPASPRVENKTSHSWPTYYPAPNNLIWYKNMQFFLLYIYFLTHFIPD